MCDLYCQTPERQCTGSPECGFDKRVLGQNPRTGRCYSRTVAWNSTPHAEAFCFARATFRGCVRRCWKKLEASAFGDWLWSMAASLVSSGYDISCSQVTAPLILRAYCPEHRRLPHSILTRIQTSGQPEQLGGIVEGSIQMFKCSVKLAR